MSKNEPNYFKIVKTMENGRTQLSPVPRLWEINGKLMWPPKNKKEKALKYPLRPPGTVEDGWTEYDCVLKRSYIPTYGEALKEINMMIDKSDTSDADAIFRPAVTKNKRSAGARKITPLVENADQQRSNFNELRDNFSGSSANPIQRQMQEPLQHIYSQEPISPHQLVLPQQQITPQHHIQPQQQITPQQQIQPQQQITPQQQILPQHQITPHKQNLSQQQQIQTQMHGQATQIQSKKQISSQQMYYLGDDGQIIIIPPTCDEECGDPANTVEAMLYTLVESNAKTHTRLEYSIKLQEEILERLSKIPPSTESTTTTKNVPHIQLENAFEPIDTVAQLEAFEANLRTSGFVDKLCTQFYSICGPRSGLTGDDVCYKLVDSVFSRRLFTLVSWTGLSRTETKKVNFSRFVLTFKLFLQLVKRCDPNITETSLKKFFQKIMDNSTRRNEVCLSKKPKRSSAVKHQSSINIKRRKIQKKTSSDENEYVYNYKVENNDSPEETENDGGDESEMEEPQLQILPQQQISEHIPQTTTTSSVLFEVPPDAANTLENIIISKIETSSAEPIEAPKKAETNNDDSSNTDKEEEYTYRPAVDALDQNASKSKQTANQHKQIKAPKKWLEEKRRASDDMPLVENKERQKKFMRKKMPQYRI